MKLLYAASAFFASVAFLPLAVNACSCFPRSFCEQLGDADVVVHANVLQRTTGDSINDDTVYDIELLEIFKGELEEGDGDEMSFDIVTGGNSALCGIYLELGVEYLIDLNRDEYNGGRLQAVGLCGLYQPWSFVTDETMGFLNGGCDDCDPCNGTCGEFQECLTYSEGSYDEHYCADVCDPSPCRKRQKCTLEEVECLRDPCPPVAKCSRRRRHDGD